MTGGELFQQSLVGIGQPAAGLDQVGAVAQGAVQGLSPPPALDAGVVAAAQHLGHRPAPELGRAGVLRLLEQAELRRSSRCTGLAALPIAPGSSRVTASITRQAATSPPLSTTSPTLSSPSTRCSRTRWSMPS